MSSLFMTDGSDPFSHIRTKISRVHAVEFEGVWASVELQPNPFIPQRFTIGIIVGNLDGGFAYRLLSDASKFECVYGKKVSAFLRPIIESAEQTLLRLSSANNSIETIEFANSCLSLSEPWPTSGKSPEQVLKRLYSEAVTMEPSTEKQSRDFVSMDTGQVRQLVQLELKRIAGMKYEKIVVEPKHVIKADDGSGQHTLEFNLRPTKGAGSVLSAVYKTPDTVELNLLRSSRDLATYARIRKVDDLAMFIMTAKQDQYNSSDFAKMRNLIDEQSWRLERQGFRVISFDEPLPIAQSILEWASVAE